MPSLDIWSKSEVTKGAFALAMESRSSQSPRDRPLQYFARRVLSCRDHTMISLRDGKGAEVH